MIGLIIAIAVGFAVGIEIHSLVRVVLSKLAAPAVSEAPVVAPVKSDVPPVPPVA